MPHDFCTSEEKGWSNVSGYGNIVMSQVKNHQVSSEISPWNRIQGLSQPTSTNVDVKYAWTPPVSTQLKETLFKTCHLCPQHLEKECRVAPSNLDQYDGVNPQPDLHPVLVNKRKK